MSIGKQLIAMLSIAILGILAVFSIGLTKMTTVYEKANYASVNTVPSILVIDDALAHAYAIRVSIWKHVAIEKQEEMKKIEIEIENAKKTFLKNYKHMKDCFLMPKIKCY